MRRLVLLLVLGAALWGAPGAFAAGWCGNGPSGTDRFDVVTGPQVHAIWVVPSDGADTFATGAPRMADDVGSILSWWQGQDPTRVPRFDLAAFPGGTCLDISSFRLAESGASLVGDVQVAFDLMAAELNAAGFSNPYKKYYVYYDGPTIEQGVCGVGAGDFGAGPSYAITFLSGCSARVQSDNVGAHELLHALGALPVGAPHTCPDTPGHPCDSTSDILYPYNSGLPLASTILDVNHDDYYAHSGSWDDIQDSSWLHRLDLPQFPLAVSFKGKGIVRSDLPGVDCSVACTTAWDSGTSLGLTTFSVPGWRFVGWHGACTGLEDCLLTMGAAQSVSAEFGPARIRTNVSVAGKGRVSCTPGCSKSFLAGRALVLRPVAAKGWKFSGWTGVCKGKGLVCRPATDYSFSARAVFKKLPAKKKPRKR